MNKYIDNLIAAMRANQHARLRYFPMNKKDRRKMNLVWAKSIGYGLKEGDDLGSLYSTCVVVFSFDSIGVCVSNKEFLEAVREGIRAAKE